MVAQRWQKCLLAKANRWGGDNALHSLRHVVKVTTVSLGAEVEFTLRPRNCRPCIVDNEGANAFSANFLENAPPEQEVQMGTALHSIQVGTVALALAIVIVFGIVIFILICASLNRNLHPIS